MSAVLVALAFACIVHAEISCIDGNGRALDWYVAYKLPAGYSFAYTNGSSASDLSRMQSKDISDDESALGYTLNQLYSSDSSSLAYVAYNDEYPTSYGPAPSEGAHAKGVIAIDGDSAFWLVHSLPKFPDFTIPLSQSWEAAAGTYGQTFMCLSIDPATADAIAKQFLIAQAHTYVFKDGSSAPDSFSALYNKQWISQSTHTLSFDVGSMSFASFIKSPSWGQDLYEDLVEPSLKISSGFAWETWRRSPFLPPYCPPDYAYPSVNVEEVTVGGTQFKYTDDHSKWGVSLDSHYPYSCIGGINRMQSQRERGGGTVCFSHKNVHSALSSCVVDYDQCSSALDTRHTATRLGAPQRARLVLRDN